MQTTSNVIPVCALSCECDNTNMLNVNLAVKNDFVDDADLGFNSYNAFELMELIKSISLCFNKASIRVIFNGIEPLVYAHVIKEFIELVKNKKWEINMVTSLTCDIENMCLLFDDIDKWYIITKAIDKGIYDDYLKSNVNNILSNLAILSWVDKSKIKILNSKSDYAFVSQLKNYNFSDYNDMQIAECII